ncbi:MAG: hypothetical protein CW335_00805 [Clostridiales bacterium]|nr:hypothetical protein [Clostridiales bacterium]
MNNVQIVGKINDIYDCIGTKRITDDVVITEERIEHIRTRHPNDYEKFCSFLTDIIENPDYIIEDKKPNTAGVLKEITENGEKFKLVLRIKVECDPTDYKDSVLSFWKIGDTTWKKTLKNKKTLQKRINVLQLS